MVSQLGVEQQSRRHGLVKWSLKDRRLSMKRSGRTPRKPATKFPNLRKKLVKNKVLTRRLKKK
jgi:hypothetical protein